MPPLEQTLEKYKHTMKALLTAEEHEEFTRMVDRFGGPGCIGTRLQLYLLNRQENMKNWVSFEENIVAPIDISCHLSK